LKTPQSAGNCGIGHGREARMVCIMRVHADATHTVARTVNRLVIDSEAAFDDVRHCYKSLLPTIDFAELTAPVIAGDLAAISSTSPIVRRIRSSTSGRSTQTGTKVALGRHRTRTS
jgi:hypothetical protein